jgi:hypothetical protein
MTMSEEFRRREENRQKRLEQTLDGIREKPTRTPEDVAELRARLARLEQGDNPAHPEVVDLDGPSD